MLGKTIKIKKEHISHVGDLHEAILDGCQMVEQGNKMIREKRKNLWVFIGELYPETKEYNMILDHKTNEIRIIGDKRKT